MENLSEDIVRDKAKIILWFDENEKNVQQWTWQLTTFKKLWFSSDYKPDGRYLPKDTWKVAIIFEAKSSDKNLYDKKREEELFRNVKVVQEKYKSVVWILYNWNDIRVFKNNVEVENISKKLENKSYYFKLFTDSKIDTQLIFNLTKQINDSLHFQFWIKNLYHRMIFTACALVAKRYDAMLVKWMTYDVFKSSILSKLQEVLREEKKKNPKLEYLCNIYASIEMNSDNNQEAIDNFIKCVSKISDCVNSDNWNGEDVMWIFFNEFNRYKWKAQSWQVFTPDHITSLMYRLIDINQNDVILDAACGSGAFLVKSMCNMIKESWWNDTAKAKEIKSKQLYGIEFDKEIFALACANMLIHKDWKTNLEQLDSRTAEACEWIKSKPITKVLMNPPFENKYGCMTIVKNVLDNVPYGTKCAFILPDKKLEKVSSAKKLLNHHKLEKIIKLPEKVFFEWITTSVFIFTAWIPQNWEEIFGCYIEDDGLETVKNQGRQDIKWRWEEIENYRVNAIKKQNDEEYHTAQRINPSENLSYQMPKKEFEITEEDFEKTVMDYLMFEEWIDVKEFKEDLINKIMYNSDVEKNNDKVFISINGSKKDE